jgi:protein CpxP
MKKRIIVGLVWVLILAVDGLSGGVSWAGHRDGEMFMGGHHKGKDEGPMKILKKLDLTQEQQEKVDAILAEHQSEKQVLHENIKNAKKSLREAMHADAFNEEAIRSASKTLSANMEEMAVFRGKIFAEIRPLLTWEQIEKLSEMRIRPHERMKCKKMMEE